MKKYTRVLLILAALLFTVSCGPDPSETMDDSFAEEAVEEKEEKDTEEERDEPDSEEQKTEDSSQTDAEAATLSDADKHAIASAKENGNLDYSFVSGKTFKVYGSRFALEWSDEFEIDSYGVFTGRATYGGETQTVYDYTGSFGAIEPVSEKCYSFEIKKGEGYMHQDASVTLYDKGFAVDDLPDLVKEWSDFSLYKDITSGDTLPCQIIYNIDDGSVYAEKSYMAELRPEDNMDTTEDGVVEKTPFYATVQRMKQKLIPLPRV